MLKQTSLSDCFRKFADLLDDPAVRDKLHLTDPKSEGLGQIWKAVGWYAEHRMGVRLTSAVKGETMDLLNNGR